MPEWLIVIVLGIVEGITEFIPVSSTGHLLLCEHWLGWHDELFTIVIQSAAVLAVVPLFWGRIRQFADLRSPAARDYLPKVIAAFAITAIGGFALDRMGFKLPDRPVPIAIALIVGGVLFLVVEKLLAGKQRTQEITWRVALVVGAAQLIAAVFPGASRSGTTILLALLLGVKRPAATEFSFLVGIPTMIAAGGWKVFKALTHHEAMPPVSLLLLGSVSAAIVSFVVVKWLLRFVQSHTFVPFGWYRIAFGVLLLLLLSR